MEAKSRERGSPKGRPSAWDGKRVYHRVEMQEQGKNGEREKVHPFTCPR